MSRPVLPDTCLGTWAPGHLGTMSALAGDAVACLVPSLLTGELCSTTALLPRRHLLFFTRGGLTSQGEGTSSFRCCPQNIISPEGLFCFSSSSLFFPSSHPSIRRPPSQSSPKTYNHHVYWTSLILGFFESCLIDPLIFSSSLAQALLAPLLPCLH